MRTDLINQTEALVLSSILFNPTLIEDISIKLKPNDFYFLPHKDIYEAMLNLHSFYFLNLYTSIAITKTLILLLGFFRISQAMAFIVFPVVKTSSINKKCFPCRFSVTEKSYLVSNL